MKVIKLLVSLVVQDILNLVYICETNGLPEAANYWQQVQIHSRCSHALSDFCLLSMLAMDYEL